MKKIISSVTLALMILSCDPSSSPDANKSLKIDLSKKNRSPLFQDFTTSIKTINLETHKNNLIGEVDQLCKDDSIIFLLDRNQEKLFLFSTSGKFLSQIHKNGKGPGEFVETTTFGVNKTDDIIYIYDIQLRKLLEFNYKGEFIEETIGTINKNFYRNLCVRGDGNLLMANPDYCNPALDGVWESNKNGEHLYQYSNVKKDHLFGWMVFPYFSQFENTISYYNAFTNKIYTFYDKNIKCKLDVDLKQALPEKFLKKSEGTGKGTGSYYMNCGMAESNYFYFLEFRSNEKGKIFVLYNKINKTIKISKSLLNNHHTWKYATTGLFSYTSDSFILVDFGKNPNINPVLKIIKMDHK